MRRIYHSLDGSSNIEETIVFTMTAKTMHSLGDPSCIHGVVQFHSLSASARTIVPRLTRDKHDYT